MIKVNAMSVLILAALILWLELAWAKADFITLTQQQIDNIGINTSKPEPAKHVPLFSAPAKVVVPPANEFIVSTASAGLLIKLSAAVGDKVSKGQVIGMINSPEILTLQGNYLQAIGALNLATAKYNRDLSLRKEGIVSGKSEQEAHSALNAAVIEVNETKQLLQIAGMTVKDIKHLDSTSQLDNRINIRSPITGRVIERMAVAGSRVDNQTPLYRIANLDELWLEINIPQAHIDDIAIGEKILIEDSLVEAEIKVLSQSVNPDNQTIQARAIIKNNSASVRVGQKVTIQYLQNTAEEAYLITDNAVVYHGEKAFVFIKDKGGFKVREIKVLGKQAGASVISGNFLNDEEIAINNTAALKASWLGLGGDE